MDEKISLDAIAQYGDAYADKVLMGFFGSKDRITGSEILTLCNVQQVNLFVVHGLFKSWKEENKHLRSPYFNYENPEIKEALENLMTLLSNNISIDQNHFEPLLKKAVSQALLVVFDPYDFFSMIITGKDNKLEVESFKEDIKYLKVNKAPLEKMLRKLEEKGVKEISGNEAFSILDQILEEVGFNPEDVEAYLEKFSTVIPLDANKFYVTPPQGDDNTSGQLRPPQVMDPPPEPPAPPVVVEKPKTVAASTPPAPAVNKPKTTVTQGQNVPSINETLIRQGKPAIAGSFQKVAKIKDSLSINQKFMFTKVLFHGDFELFSKAIDHLDKLDNMKSALRYIEDEHAGSWDNESEEFHEFMELVEKRFA